MYATEDEKNLFDQEFWRHIYPVICDYAILYIHYYGLSSDITKDIVHEAITRVLIEKRKWDPNKTQFLPYLKGVIKSLVSHYYESAYQKKRIRGYQSQDDKSTNFEDTAVSTDFTSQQYLERTDLEKFLWDEADGDEDMQLVLLCIFEEKRRSEISEELNLPLNEVDNILKRIRRATIKYLNGSE